MAQRHNSTRGASREQTQSAAGALRWYGAGVASGLFSAFLLYLVTLPAERADPPAPRASVDTDAPAPQYEFYEVLPRQQIAVSDDPTQTSAPPETGVRYLLQAGSFRQAQDADQRRAKLLLLGLAPRIEEARGDTGRWYRVVLGPFESRSAMAKARSLTAQEDIDTLLIQRKTG